MSSKKDKEVIERLYFNKNFEELFKFVGKDKEKRLYLCKLICEKRKKFAKEFRKVFKPTGDLLKDVLEIYKAYFGIEVPKDGKIIEANKKGLL